MSLIVTVSWTSFFLFFYVCSSLKASLQSTEKEKKVLTVSIDIINPSLQSYTNKSTRFKKDFFLKKWN